MAFTTFNQPTFDSGPEVAELLFFDELLSKEIHVHLLDGFVYVYELRSLDAREVREAVARALFHSGPTSIEAIALPNSFGFYPFLLLANMVAVGMHDAHHI